MYQLKEMVSIILCFPLVEKSEYYNTIADKSLNNTHTKGKKCSSVRIILSKWSTRFTCTLSVNATLNILIVTGAIFLKKKKGEELFKYNLKKPLLEECLMQGNNPSWSVVCQKQR